MSSGSLLRGHLRPAGARGPPFLILGLLIVVGVLAFNYWNLSSEYEALLKELSDLQDHLRMAALKKDNAERQYEALERRFRDTEGQLSKVKVAADEQQNEIAKASEKLETRLEELNRFREQLNTCQNDKSKLELSQGQLQDLQKKYQSLDEEKMQLTHENQKMLTIVRDLRNKLEEMAMFQTRMGFVHGGAKPPMIRSSATNDVNYTDVRNNTSNFSSIANDLREDVDKMQRAMQMNETDGVQDEIEKSQSRVEKISTPRPNIEDGNEIEKGDYVDSSETEKQLQQTNLSEKQFPAKNFENDVETGQLSSAKLLPSNVTSNNTSVTRNVQTEIQDQLPEEIQNKDDVLEMPNVNALNASGPLLFHPQMNRIPIRKSIQPGLKLEFETSNYTNDEN